MLVTLERHVCSYILRAEDGRNLLFQTDWDYPSLAAAFGWTLCPCGETDGTVDCLQYTAADMIAEASIFLDARVGESIVDPGYFG